MVIRDLHSPAAYYRYKLNEAYELLADQAQFVEDVVFSQRQNAGVRRDTKTAQEVQNSLLRR